MERKKREREGEIFLGYVFRDFVTVDVDKNIFHRRKEINLEDAKRIH